MAAASGSQPIDGLAPLYAGRRGSDRVARACRARRGAQRSRRVCRTAGDDLGTRTRRRPGACEQGKPGGGGRSGYGSTAAWGRSTPPCRQRALRCVPVPRGADRRDRALAGADRLGRAFRGRTRAELAGVTPDEALAHPTWNMGPKITVDSATLANKGLELIEAHFLFDLDYNQIEVVIHPTSTVHALVRFRDGAALAHLGYPDMRVPISFALTYPDRARRRWHRSTSRRPDARVRAARPRDVSAACPGPPGRRARRHLPVRLQRGERSRGGGLPRGTPVVPRDRRDRRGNSCRGRRRAGTRPRRALRGRRPGTASCRTDGGGRAA